MVQNNIANILLETADELNAFSHNDLETLDENAVEITKASLQLAKLWWNKEKISFIGVNGAVAIGSIIVVNKLIKGRYHKSKERYDNYHLTNFMAHGSDIRYAQYVEFSPKTFKITFRYLQEIKPYSTKIVKLYSDLVKILNKNMPLTMQNAESLLDDIRKVSSTLDNALKEYIPKMQAIADRYKNALKAAKETDEYNENIAEMIQLINKYNADLALYDEYENNNTFLVGIRQAYRNIKFFDTLYSSSYKSLNPVEKTKYNIIYTKICSELKKINKYTDISDIALSVYPDAKIQFNGFKARDNKLDEKIEEIKENNNDAEE